MLGRVIGEHWHALVRDVLALGFRKEDILTTLDVADMVAIVVAAPPSSSVRFFQDGGWSREAHLLANMQEERAGVAHMDQPYERPGLEERPGWGPGQGGPGEPVMHAEAFTWQEFDELNKKRYAYADELAAKGIKSTNTRVRTL